MNAGGALCLGYCDTFAITAQPEHCPLEKSSDHCDKKVSQDTGSDAIAASTDEMDCCPLAVS
ncbi:MAG: hypothetical protein ABIU09_06770, partial [Pyrinomonadaceae bacterium]